MGGPPVGGGGRRLRSDIGVLQIVSHPNVGGSARVTISVSKKVVKLAVERNRIKRRVRSLFAAHPAPQGSSYIFYPTALLLRMQWKILEASFSELIKKI